MELPPILSRYKAAYNIFTGNMVVLKPASESTVIEFKISEFFEQAGLLAGVLNVITVWEVYLLGDALVDDDRCSFVNITGETVRGRHVAQRVAAKLKPYILELGGENLLIILADAYIDRVVKSVAFSAYLNQGEICMSADRIIEERPIVEDFTLFCRKP